MTYSLVHEAFCATYGSRQWKPGRPGLDELVLTILSQSTTDRNSGRAYVALRQQYPTWADVAVTSPADIALVIQVAGLAVDKAERIVTVLNHPDVQAAGYTLDFLADMALPDALEWLTRFHGIGLKTAGCVLLFAYGKPILPVDTHIARVAYRLGLTTSPGPDHAHRVLNESIPGALHYAAHMHLIQLGRLTCHAHRPRCESCPVATLCRMREEFARAT